MHSWLLKHLWTAEVAHRLVHEVPPTGSLLQCEFAMALFPGQLLQPGRGRHGFLEIAQAEKQQMLLSH